MAKWTKPTAPPPPMFLGEKEKNLVKQVNDEIIERVVGQQVLYFPIDIKHTNFHPLYGEAINKTYLPPIRVYARVEYGGIETAFVDNIGVDKDMPLNINDALVRLEKSKVLNKYLSKEYVKIYVDLKRKEQESFNSEISNTELKWYLNL